MTIQGLLSYLLALIMFRKDAKEYIKEFTMTEDKIKDAAHRAKRREMSTRWSYRIFLVIFCFVIAGVLEEGLKYLALMCASRYGTITHDRDYLIITAAAAVGFATVENLAFVYGSYKNNESPLKLTITILERTIVGLPGHAMTAALIGVNVLARDVRGVPMTLSQILGVLVLLHGCHDLVLFIASAYEGNVGWVHPRKTSTMCVGLGLVIGIQAILVGLLRRRMEELQVAYWSRSLLSWTLAD